MMSMILFKKRTGGMTSSARHRFHFLERLVMTHGNICKDEETFSLKGLFTSMLTQTTTSFGFQRDY